MTIDRNGYTPLYIQFYQLMKEEITSYTPGTNLPPERVLCEKYKLDRMTVRKALAMLAEEKLIERKQGRGTQVLPKEEKPAKDGSILFALYHGSQLVDRLGEPFYARSMDALERYLHKINERLVYSKVHREDTLITLCEHLAVKGVILAGMADDTIVAQSIKLPIPVISYNSKCKGLPAVLADNGGGAALAAEHFLNLGHRRIGFIHVPGYLNSETRLSHFTRILADAGAPEPVVVKGDWSEKGGYEALQNLVKNEPRVTAVFTGNDSMAIGALRAAEDMGLSVPREISIMGFDGITQSAMTTPPLTTVQVDISAMAEAACMLLFHMFQNGMSPDISAVVSTKLIERASTAKVPQRG